MGINEGIDPNKLAEAGWGLIMPASLDPQQMAAIRDGLSPLLEWRKSQAGQYYREFIGLDGFRPDDTKNSWLARYGVGPGPADPTQIPYYLLIAASPQDIPFSFQLQLDIVRSVGRISFETIEEWHAYAESVVRAEKLETCPARMALFYPTFPGDGYTQNISTRMRTLGERLSASPQMRHWTLQSISGEQATKPALIGLMKENAPGVILFAGHSLIFPPDAERQVRQQGGLVCAGWGGPGHDPFDDNLCFLSSDVPEWTDLCGRLVLAYTSFSLGTSVYDPFYKLSDSQQKLGGMASRPFNSHLPQRLLSLSGGRGALGVIGWIDRLWGYSAATQATQENLILESVLKSLAAGQTVGLALEQFNERYAELATVLGALLEDIEFGKQADPAGTAGIWVGTNNARGIAFFGDPAVRLRVVTPAKETDQHSTLNLESIKTALSAAQAERAPRNTLVMELRLERGKAGGYLFNMQCAAPDGQEYRVESPVHLDLIAMIDSSQPGQRLTKSPFVAPEALNFLNQVRQMSTEQNLPISVRLIFNNAELYNLPWEALLDPQKDEFLFTTDRWLLTRSLSTASLGATEPGRVAKPRALVVVMNPSDLDGFGHSTVDRAAETDLARAVLSEYEITVLESPTLFNLEKELRQGYEVLYLCCLAVNVNGVKRKGTHLFFEREDGTANIVSSADFASFFGQMQAARRPRLIALIPPRTALDPQVPSNFAPVLLNYGIPAVLSFQKKMPLDKLQIFLGEFFHALAQENAPEQAINAGRRAAGFEQEGWKGVFYTRQPATPLWARELTVSNVSLSQKNIPAAVSQPGESELQICLYRESVAEYQVEIRLNLTGDDAGRTVNGTAQFDFGLLRGRIPDPNWYGKLLTENLFADPYLREFFLQARMMSQLFNQNIKLRLVIDSSAIELHDLSWENLLDPERGTPLAMNENLSFARYLVGSDWRRIAPRSERKLRALVVIASPVDLNQYSLSSIDTSTHLAIAQRNLSGMDLTMLSSGSNQPAMWNAMMEHLQRGIDLVWLVCHSAARQGEIGLFLENECGEAQFVKGQEVTQQILALSQPPRLFVMAGVDTTTVGVQLASAGAANTLTNNGMISMETYQRFINIFFHELLQDGQADRAAAVARSVVRNRPDWWVPVLMIRNRSGKVW